MKLKQALKRVTALLPKDESKSFFTKVRFAHTASAVFVTDGIISSTAYVDCDVPDLLCDSSVILKAVKDKGDLSIEEIGGGKVALCSEVNKYILQGENISSFPIPRFPSKIHFVEADLANFNLVIYAASKNSKGGGIPYLNFGNNIVEATDTVRLVRLEISPNILHIGAIPIEFFNKWPKKIKEGAFGRDSNFLYFKLDDEYRITVIPQCSYPDTNNAIKLSENRGLIAVDKKQLLETVVQATEISEIKGVQFEFGDELKIKALGREEVLTTYVGSIKKEGKIKEGKISVNGKLLAQGLRNIKQKIINMTYGVYPEPLVIRGGPVNLYTWPMLNE